jgi:MoaA/NifB/PqqE/SkfB family radical SAM enzyme
MRLEEELKELYQFDKIYNVADFFGLPSSTLYRTLYNIKQETFKDNQRIIFFCQNNIDNQQLIHFFNKLQECLNFIDIGNFFVLVVGSDENIPNMLEQARFNKSVDTTPIGFYYCSDDKTYPDITYSAILNPPETVCAQPWISLDINVKGQFRPCCFYTEVFNDNNGVPFHVKKNTLKEVYHSDAMKTLRQDFLNGNKPTGCDRCWREEEDKTVSKRQLLKHRIPESYDADWEVEDVKNVKLFSLAFGNVCNLKCRICNAAHSSRIAEEAIRLDKGIIDKKLHPAYKVIQQGKWVQDDSPIVWEELEDPDSGILYFDFSGGEPMLSNRHFEFIAELVRNGRSKDISVHYNTNGTIFPKKYAHLFSKFKRMEIAISIDNLAERFDYERSGANWSEVKENVKKYLDIQGGPVEIALHLAISIQNVYYLPEIFNWIATQNFTSVHCSTLYYPNSLNISNVTKDARDLILQRLMKYNAPTDHLQSFIDSTIVILNDAPLSNGVEFCRYMKKLDSARNESFAELYPEVARAMGY